MKDEDLLWAAIPFMGGISGENKATCGAVSGSAVTIALRHRTPLSEKEKAKAARNKARFQSALLVKEFAEKFGHMNCFNLLDIDFSIPGNYKKFRDSGIAEEKCNEYVNFIIEKLYSFETVE